MKKLKLDRKTLINRLDDAFSNLVRRKTIKKYGGRCPFCFINPVECVFHFITRSKYSIRWDERNAIGSCRACNFRNKFDPHNFIVWYIKHNGVDSYIDLVKRGNKPADFSTTDLEDKYSEIEKRLQNKKMRVRGDKMKFLQQGDVLLKSASVPEGAREIPATGRGYILAEGEATGHAHRIEDVAGVEFLEKDGRFYVVNMRPVTIRHEEHKSLTLPPGRWEVGKIREYNHFEEETREVRD